MATSVIALCADREILSASIQNLYDAGFDADDISVVMRADGKLPDARVQTRADVGEAAAAGAAVGAGASAIGAGLVTIAGLTLSGVGVLAAGPLALILSAAGTAGVAGGMTGALIGAGVPSDVARRYVDQLEGGAGVIGVHVDDDNRQDAINAFSTAGVSDVEIIDRQWRPKPGS
ncbi:MAG: hypothetical protein ACF8R7_02915 [Phycisphaerales bacterium JB039]